MNSDVVSETEDSSKCNGIVEVKCPITALGVTTEDQLRKVLSVKSMLHRTNPYFPNKQHDCYYQVQGALRHTKAHYCIFSVWSEHVMIYCVVLRDDKFWKEQMESKLIRFYENCLRPEILDSRKERGLSIREPDYVIQIKKKEEEKVDLDKSYDSIVEVYSDFDSSSSSLDTDEFEELFEKVSKEQDKDEDIFSEMKDNDSDDAENVYKVEKINVIKKIKICEESDDDIQIIETDTAEVTERKVRDNLHVFPLTECRDLILKGEWLNEVCLDKMIHLLRTQSGYKEILSFQYMLYPELIPPFERKFYQQDLQIIGGVQSGHWRTLFFDGTSLYILDSYYRNIKFNDLKEDEKNYIKGRYPFYNTNDIKALSVTVQPDGTSCGVYAVANAVSIIFQEDP